MRENYTRINLVQFSSELNTNLESFDVRPVSTHILNLKYSSQEQLNYLAQSHRRKLPKLQDQEFRLAEIDSDKDVMNYFALIEATAKRQGRKPFYRPDFYQILFDIFSDSPNLYWPKVVLDGSIVASAIIFMKRGAAIYWDGASSARALETGGNFFLFWEIIQLLKERNFDTLDFGASPHKNVGLKKFKTGWGSDKFTYFEYDYRKPFRKFADQVRRIF